MLGLITSNITLIISGKVAAYKVNEYNAIYLTTIFINIVKMDAINTTIKQLNNKLKKIIRKLIIIVSIIDFNSKLLIFSPINILFNVAKIKESSIAYEIDLKNPSLAYLEKTFMSYIEFMTFLKKLVL